MLRMVLPENLMKPFLYYSQNVAFFTYFILYMNVNPKAASFVSYNLNQLKKKFLSNSIFSIKKKFMFLLV